MELQSKLVPEPGEDLTWPYLSDKTNEEEWGREGGTQWALSEQEEDPGGPTLTCSLSITTE